MQWHGNTHTHAHTLTSKQTCRCYYVSSTCPFLTSDPNMLPDELIHLALFMENVRIWSHCIRFPQEGNGLGGTYKSACFCDVGSSLILFWYLVGFQSPSTVIRNWLIPVYFMSFTVFGHVWCGELKGKICVRHRLSNLCHLITSQKRTKLNI